MRRLVVISNDAMVTEDLDRLKDRPAYGEMIRKGARVEKGLRTIYPSLTYPIHTTILTGCRAGTHGIINNSPSESGNMKMPWFWFHDAVKVPDLHDAAKAAGMSTASVFWPVTGNHPSVDYLIAEYWAQSKDETNIDAYRRAGSSEELLRECVLPAAELLSKYGDGPEADQGATMCACAIIRKYKPQLLTLHLSQIDGRRHSFGVFNDKVDEAIDEAESYLAQLMEACRDAGVYEETNFVVLSDHGQLNFSTRFNANRLFREAGLVDMEAPEKPESWKAWVNSACLSAHVFLKDPEDQETRAKVLDLLQGECGPGKGIERIYTAEEAAKEEGLFGDFSYVLEASEDVAFTANWQLPLYSKPEPAGPGYTFGNHGHHPDKGPQPVFLAMGPQIKAGANIERARVIDEAPTLAAILGIELPTAEGRVLTELLA